MTDTILITGASGQLGRGVINHLLESQGVAASRIIAGTRDPRKLTDLAAKGVAVRHVDFDDAANLESGFAGVGTILVISTDALDGAGTRLRQHKAAIAAAAKAGVSPIPHCPKQRVPVSVSRRITSSPKKPSKPPACHT